MPILETSDKFVLTAVSSSKADLVSETYPEAAIFDNPSDLICGSDVDCVVITAPNDVHAPIAKTALENGKHVIVEKPMATNSREAAELVSIAKENSLIVSVFQNRRWDGDFLTVKKLLAEGTLGEIRVFESRYDRFRPTVRQRWREEQLKAGVLPTDPSFGRSGDESSGRLYHDGKETVVETEVGAYQHYYEAIAETIESGSPNPVSNRDSRDVMKILDLAEKSSRERRTLSFT